jgi:hypothetical protein
VGYRACQRVAAAVRGLHQLIPGALLAWIQTRCSHCSLNYQQACCAQHPRSAPDHRFCINPETSIMRRVSNQAGMSGDTSPKQKQMQAPLELWVALALVVRQEGQVVAEVVAVGDWVELA